MQTILLLGGAILLLFFLTAHAFYKLRIPTLLGFILIGFILSGIFKGEEINFIHDIGQISLVLLFFLVGLKFPLNYLINIFSKIWQVGFLDIFLNFGVSFLIAYLFGLNFLNSLIIGGVVYATSSSITKKMLEETGRQSTPEADFKLAFLLFEDITVPIIITLLTSLSLGEKITFLSILSILLKVIITIAVALIFTIYVFRRLELFVKRYLDADYMPLFLMAITFITAGVALYFGLSKLLGAFLAGVMISETLWGEELYEKILPLKNLLLPFFFFWFGTSISIGTDVMMPVLLTILVIWAVLGKFILGWFGGRIYGLSKKSSLRASFSLIHRGEFSVIIASIADSTALITFSGLFIILTAIIGVMLFHKSPYISSRLFSYI
ncbi:cation:proton antiporter [Natranaerofaba carboxydovora]|uniref:cation:proton antiporter n=1 Tax=Natranaerofaba carboxydovora TaxID=2742683 RepID=UPI001F129F77|nr:cation:proton antiporter [Natranaerofaba carboxydovora]UMZ74118.1 Ammonium/H(+) antiporter subunit AmhT [Natranaerofaba carboxydovora]